MKMRGIGQHSEIQLVAKISVVDRQRIMEHFSLRTQKRKEKDSLKGFYAATKHLATLKIQPPTFPYGELKCYVSFLFCLAALGKQLHLC